MRWVLALPALALAALLFLGVGRYGWFQPARTVDIESSWGFDLADPEAVFGYSHFVVMGRVEERLGRRDVSTVFLVTPLEEIKGSVPKQIRVAQTGFKRGNITFELREQPLLKVGQTYVLGLTALGDKTDTLTVVAGPVSGQPWDPEDDAAVKKARSAVAKRRWPPEFGAPLAQQRHELRSILWTAGRPGYRAEPPTVRLP